jgi:hypothetical protein
MCLATAGWTTNRAEAWLHQAGTAEDYPGLYRAAREFKPPTDAQLAAVTELPEVARISSLVDTMVVIDGLHDWLEKSQKAGWKSPPRQADISPAHEGTILWEEFREMARTPDSTHRPPDFRRELADAEQAAARLRNLMTSHAPAEVLDAAFKQVTQSCTACHKAYRNQ